MAKINTIKEYDVANGPGVRMSVWFQGCPHKCTGCFNEETWDKDGKGDVYSETHLQKIISILGSSPVHKDLSILGGEPLVNYNLSLNSNQSLLVDVFHILKFLIWRKI